MKESRVFYDLSRRPLNLIITTAAYVNPLNRNIFIMRPDESMKWGQKTELQIVKLQTR